MSDAPTPSWFRIGHVTYPEERTGCTAILFDELVPTVVDVRGGAPGTRETDLLRPGMTVARANAILLTGGSAFGLAAADGVMRYLGEQGHGFPTAAGAVPIVPATVIFDLAVGQPRFPTAEDGYRAAASATSGPWTSGQIGAGAGATVAKLGGDPRHGGLAVGVARVGDDWVTAIVVLNAVGDVRDPDTGSWLARAADPAGQGRGGRDLAIAGRPELRQVEHTTIGAILLSRPTSRDALARCCIAAHDALARCVIPAHTVFDGDTFFASCPRLGDASASDTLALSAAAEIAVERGIVGLFHASPSEDAATD